MRPHSNRNLRIYRISEVSPNVKIGAETSDQKVKVVATTIRQVRSFDEDVAIKTEDAFEVKAGKKFLSAIEAVSGLARKYLVKLRDFPNEFGTTHVPHHKQQEIAFDDNLMMVQDEMGKTVSIT